ncbi:signal transduction histidine kinase [Kibdelosporangium banguiense]|uniref:histidine kinase n=1 Tax=Kibdelosporangium banguiense TaxID=1365924 RepID=A0ABS4THL8_9PSEU|nr:sensor domain-containing protein [Kibdelosporangium banguiense]MBP2323928.1 signal transduction histidine kinase [Kibdelosporangium banguiense]
MFTRRTWAELLYALTSLPLSVLGLVLMVLPLLLGTVLSIAFVGLPVMALGVLLARGLGNVHRGLASALLGVHVGKPARPAPRQGIVPSVLLNAASWRAVLYVILKAPVGLVTFLIPVGFWVYGLFMLTHVTYWWALSENLQLPLGRYRIDTWPNAVLFAASGLALVMASPHVTHAVLFLDRLLVRGLLGPTTLTQRVRDLEETRAHAVDDAAARLRQIERDLHDGTQARMVALAMHLGMVKEELEGEPDLEMTRKLVDMAHANAKEALVEVRDLARGIHPAALDKGLDAALATLASRSPIPVELSVSLPRRPPRAIEMIAYFCTAELLTNITRHSQATAATVTVTGMPLRIAVTDNGIGGAEAKPGSGLTGLRERVATVDGTVRVSSPSGGPTEIVISFPP